MSETSASPSALSRLTIQRDVAHAARPRPSWPLWLAVAAAAAAAAAYVWMPRTHEVSVANAVISTPSQRYVQLTASGYVVAQRRAAVASKATGRLVELRVREGSHVQAGELLARLDDSDIQAGIVAAQAAVLQAQANLQQANVQLTNARAELARTRGLQTQGFVSPQAVDMALTRDKAAFSGMRSAEAALAQAQAQLKLQQVNQSYTEIRAPFDGVVLVKNANIGDIITPMSSAAGTQGAVVTMADMGTLEVEADVSEGSLSKTGVGQPVEITLDALPGSRLIGHVAGIVPTADRAKATVMTKIQFDHPDARILPEMSAKVSFLSHTITAEDQHTVVAVPNTCVTQRQGTAVVFRISGEAGHERAQAVPVHAGLQLGELVTVEGNVHAGDRLVASPAAQLGDGDSVQISSN